MIMCIKLLTAYKIYNKKNHNRPGLLYIHITHLPAYKDMIRGVTNYKISLVRNYIRQLNI